MSFGSVSCPVRGEGRAGRLKAELTRVLALPLPAPRLGRAAGSAAGLGSCRLWVWELQQEGTVRDRGAVFQVLVYVCKT